MSLPRLTAWMLLAAALAAARPARARLILTPPEPSGAIAAAASPTADRLELGLTVGEAATDFVFRSLYAELSVAALCIGSCGSGMVPWPVALAVLATTPVVDAVLVWSLGAGSRTWQPDFLDTLLASYAGAAVEGALIWVGFLTGSGGLMVALGLLGSAIGTAGTVYAQMMTKRAVAPAGARTGGNPLVTLATF